MSAIVRAILGAFIGGLVDAFNAWRRDAKLEDLGYAKAQRDEAVASLDAQKRMSGVRELDRAAAVERLRNGTF